MAFTYSKLAEVTVGSGGAATIDFTNVPQNYNDLCLVFSVRSNYASTFDAIFLRANMDIGSNHSYRFLRGGGSSADSGNNSAASFVYAGQIPANSTTASTFQNASVYIPNYTSSSAKSMSIDSVGENNATSAYAIFTAGLWNNSSPIVSLRLYPENGTLIVQHSTATLYGVKAEV